VSCARPNTPRSNPKDLGELERPLRDRLWTMFQDAPSKGLALVSGYRDAGRQWDLRHDRCPGRECDSRCNGHPTTALPGRSNHGKRKAADVGGRDLRWFVANVRRYGLHLPVPGEDWHAEVAGAPTVRILTYPGACYDAPAALPVKPEPNKGRTWQTFAGAGTTDAAVYARGGLDNEVSQVQYLIGHPVTGRYTPADADDIAKLKTAAKWVDPDEPKHNRTSGVTPAFHQALEGLHGAKS
jgi:hypothetical protein